MFDSLRGVGTKNSKVKDDINNLSAQNHTGAFVNHSAVLNQSNHDLNNSVTPTPQTGKNTNKSSFISSN